MTPEEITALEASKVKLLQGNNLLALFPNPAPGTITEEILVEKLQQVQAMREGLTDTTLTAALTAANLACYNAISAAAATSVQAAQAAIDEQEGTDITV